MAVLITLHAIQALQIDPRGDDIVCRRNGEALNPRDLPEPTWSFTQAGQRHALNRTLLVGEHGDTCEVTLAARAADGPDERLGCVNIAIEQSSLCFHECVESGSATQYGGRQGKYHQMEFCGGERRYRLLFQAQLITDL